ncbi:MAG TPA: hypothetical protein VGB97_01730 [Candidatus Paceibacterota bacterium]|jgi:hypothetical protein
MTSDELNNDPGSARSIFSDIAKRDIPLPPPEWYSLAQGIIRSPLLPFLPNKGVTTEQFVLGNTGITPEEFKAGSPKGLHRLDGELEREVHLALNLGSKETREIIRSASGSACIVFDPNTEEALFEEGRIILETGAEITYDEPRPTSIRETALRKKRIREGQFVPESPIVTIQRGGLEEPGYELYRENLIPLTPIVPVIDDHDSKVYKCDARYPEGHPWEGKLKLKIRSIVVTWMFGFPITWQGLKSLDDWPEVCQSVTRKGDLMLVEDEGVLLKFKRRPLPNPWLSLLKARIAQRET